MSLITHDPVQWVYEHCATKEDILYWAEKLKEVYEAWEEDEDDEDI